MTGTPNYRGKESRGTTTFWDVLGHSSQSPCTSLGIVFNCSVLQSLLANKKTLVLRLGYILEYGYI